MAREYGHNHLIFKGYYERARRSQSGEGLVGCVCSLELAVLCHAFPVNRQDTGYIALNPPHFLRIAANYLTNFDTSEQFPCNSEQGKFYRYQENTDEVLAIDNRKLAC